METALCIFMLFLAGVSANITGQHVTTGECVCVAGTNVNARTSGIYCYVYGNNQSMIDGKLFNVVLEDISRMFLNGHRHDFGQISFQFLVFMMI